MDRLSSGTSRLRPFAHRLYIKPSSYTLPYEAIGDFVVKLESRGA